uniref:Uncharacterized protein n=1 Tax=Arion vulgaris TaxID=1028688 RepID=A0A0B7A4Y4_9EUPU
MLHYEDSTEGLSFSFSYLDNAGSYLLLINWSTEIRRRVVSSSDDGVRRECDMW